MKGVKMEINEFHINNILEDLVYMGMMMIMKDLHFMTLQFLNAYLV